MARHVRNEQCPKCAEAGRDRSKDNLGVYDDGSKYCYSCGFIERGGVSSRLISRSSGEVQHQVSSCVLPDDSEPYYPSRCVSWVNQYELGIEDLYANRVLWSEVSQRLIWPYYESSNGPLLGWQGRYFGTETHSKSGKRIPKWWGVGHLDTIYHIFNRERSRNLLVITEDVISAYKVAKTTGLAAMSLFGSHISPLKLLRLKLLTDHLTLWLDPDKRSEAVKFASRGIVLGLPTNVISSTKDPKEHTALEIRECLNL